MTNNDNLSFYERSGSSPPVLHGIPRTNEMSVAYGLRDWEFKHLDQGTKDKIIGLIARVSEASFRRGLQHGVYFTERGKKLKDLEILRYEVPLDQSPFVAMGDRSSLTAIERLEAEHGATLISIGLTGSEGGAA